MAIIYLVLGLAVFALPALDDRRRRPSLNAGPGDDPMFGYAIPLRCSHRRRHGAAVVATRPLHEMGDGPGCAARKARRARLTASSSSSADRSPRRSQDWKQYLVAMLAFNVVMFAVSFGIMALAAISAAQPRRQGRDRGQPDLQHGGLLHLEHQPAALFGRSVDELSLAARRADVAAIRVGGNRHRRARGAGARARRPIRLATSSSTCSAPRSSCSCPWRSLWRC